VIGPLEIAILVVVLLLVFGYRYLPTIGRKAGTGARELKESAQEMVGDKADPKNLGKRAGEGLREAREFRDAVTGKTPPEPTPPKEPSAQAERAEGEAEPTEPAERRT
jgi:sec-independent protein translocase protein TatA